MNHTIGSFLAVRHQAGIPPVPRRRFQTLGAAIWWYWPMLSALAIGACSLDGLLKSDRLPDNVTDPAITKTPAGAVAAYNGTIAAFQSTVGGERSATGTFVVATGLLGDELVAVGADALDLRSLDEGLKSSSFTSVDQAFQALNDVRLRAGQAIGLLADYLPEQPALRGRLYAVQGYAEVMLAELFCSGIPLSTVDYGGDYTLQPGSTTPKVFDHAAALFETAAALASDSVRFVHFSQVGRARALLGLGDYTAAAAAAAAVPDGYREVLNFLADPGVSGAQRSFAGLDLGSGLWPSYSVPDREGTNGLDYRSSGDPRTAVTLIGATYHPDKYSTDGSGALVVASGVEARLIEAEAALHADDVVGWLAKLNALRTDGTYEELAPGDTLWHAGSGGYDSLPPLRDPGASLAPADAAKARVDLLFRERAFWLFLTGHRQGDMRRLVRPVERGGYGREQSTVYPVGIHVGDGLIYGNHVDAPIPTAERELNPQFTGCASRD